MKKNLTILKTVFLFLFAVFLLQGCRNETVIDSTQENSAQKYKISIINNSKILGNNEIVTEINKFKSKLKKSSRTIQDSILEGAIVKTESVLLIETDNDKTYTFPIARTYETSKVENLVLKKKADGTYSGILMQYNLTPEEKIKYNKGQYVDLKSKIKIFNIKKLNISARIQTDVVGCYEVTWETGVYGYLCFHEEGQHDYGCGLYRSSNPYIMSVKNLCEGDGGSGGGGAGDIGNPGNMSGIENPQDSNSTEGGGNFSTLPYNGISVDMILINELTSINGFNNLSSEIRNFIASNYLLDFNIELAKFSTNFFTQNPNTSIEQFQKWFIDGALDYTNPNDVSFAGNLANLSNDLRLANQNGTLNQLQASWPNWQKIKQDIKNSVARGIHDGAKTVKTYYDEIRNNPYIYNSGTRILLNTYIDELREEMRQTTNLNTDTMKWEDLFKIWLFELMPSKHINTIDFTWASNVVNGNNIYNSTTNAVYTFPKGNPNMIPDIKAGLKNGTLNVGSSMTRYFKYDFTQFYSLISNKNIGIQMLGSYDTKATVISKSGNVVVVRFFITNILNWDSATRLVQTKDGTIGIINTKDKEIGDELHLGGNLTNTYTWEEIITL